MLQNLHFNTFKRWHKWESVITLPLMIYC
jgi:hypothetical protein